MDVEMVLAREDAPQRAPGKARRPAKRWPDAGQQAVGDETPGLPFARQRKRHSSITPPPAVPMPAMTTSTAPRDSPSAIPSRGVNRITAASTSVGSAPDSPKKMSSEPCTRPVRTNRNTVQPMHTAQLSSKSRIPFAPEKFEHITNASTGFVANTSANAAICPNDALLAPFPSCIQVPTPPSDIWDFSG